MQGMSGNIRRGGMNEEWFNWRPVEMGWLLLFPRHALHDKGLYKKRGVDRLFSSPERRAAVVPRLNTARRDPPTVYIGNRVFALPGKNSRHLSSKPWETRKSGCFLGGPTRRRPVRPHPSLPHRRAPPRPDPPVVCPGFGFDEFGNWGAPP